MSRLAIKRTAELKVPSDDPIPMELLPPMRFPPLPMNEPLGDPNARLLKDRSPAIFATFDREGNEGVDPETLTCGTNRKFSWICTLCKESYQACIRSRLTLPAWRGHAQCVSDLIDAEKKKRREIFSFRPPLEVEQKWTLELPDFIPSPIVTETIEERLARHRLDGMRGQTLQSAEKFYRIVSERGGIALDDFVSATTLCRVWCGTGHIWITHPNNVISTRDRWCRACDKQCPRAAARNFYRAIAKRGGKALESYIDTGTKRKVQCRYGHIWPCCPNDLISGGHWCPVCGNNSPEAAATKFYQIIQEKGGVALEAYIDANTHRLVQCGQGHKPWPITPHNLIRGRWCPSCDQNGGEALLSWLAETLGLPSEPQYRLPEYPRRRYDLCVFYNVHIFEEFDGDHHHERDEKYFHREEGAFEKQRKHDIEKAKLVIEEYRKRMIRFTYAVLKFDRQEVLKVYIQALQMSDPLLYIHVVDGKLCVSSDAPIYDWLTREIKLPSKSRLSIKPPSPLPTTPSSTSSFMDSPATPFTESPVSPSSEV